MFNFWKIVGSVFLDTILYNFLKKTFVMLFELLSPINTFTHISF